MNDPITRVTHEHASGEAGEGASCGTPTPEDHLTAARNWLALAEEAARARTELHAERDRFHDAPEDGDDVERLEAKFHRLSTNYDDQLEQSAILADLHRKMAEALWAAPVTLSSTIDLAGVDEALRARVKADVVEHEGARWNPATDTEPPDGEGALLTPDGKWFFYAVNGHASPNPGDEHAPRWLMIRHYAEFLRWQAAGTRPMAARWEELANLRGPGEDVVIVRRPTAGERTAFYGPEPDDVPETKPGQRVEAALADMRNREDTAPPLPTPIEEALCGACDTQGLEVPAVALNPRGWPRCAYHHAVELAAVQHGEDPVAAAAKPWRSPGGAGQWNG